ncbi:uncharacterized protein LOC116260004 isoform X1 [Nymphaea colorata]|nr:uncharacterized protein LOC116260004 isoform X1 [Nymphaea colorata]
MEIGNAVRRPKGSVSPNKLRLKLLRIQKKKKEGEETETVCSSFSNEKSELDDQAHDSSCKDVGVIDPETSTVTSNDVTCPDSSLMVHNPSPRKDEDNGRNLNGLNQNRSQEEGYYPEHDSGQENGSMSGFDFQRSSQHRVILPPFSKPAPSKWDDAGKWIPTAAPGDNQIRNKYKTGNCQPQVVPLVPKKSAFTHGSRQSSIPTKVVTEVAERRAFVAEEVDTKRIDLSHAKKDTNIPKFCFSPAVSCPLQKTGNWGIESYPCADEFGDSYSKPSVLAEVPVSDSTINFSRHDSTASINGSTTLIPPPSTVRSISMRDMGTEMTPIASQEPSRTGTPVRATTPTRSPVSSRSSTPGRVAPASSLSKAASSVSGQQIELPKKELSEKELQMKTRKEIAALGAQLGKMNIAAWASKEEEEKDASTSLKTTHIEQTPKNVIQTRAAAWEEAEKAKFMARYKREEIRIQAWENHQKAKAEAEMRRTEVEIERMRGRAHEKLMNKLAATRQKAEEKLAAAEAKRNHQAAKSAQKAEYIRRTGRIPSSFSCSGWCC